MNNLRYLCLAVLLPCMVGGCASFTTAMNNLSASLEASNSERRKAAFSSAPDKHIVSALYWVDQAGKEQLSPSVEADGFTLEAITPEGLTLRRVIFQLDNMTQMIEAYSRYAYDSENDAVSTAYIRKAKERGNQVRSYRPRMTLQLNRLFVPVVRAMGGSAEWYDRDVALIEFDSASRPVSALVRVHQAQTTIGVRSYQYVTLITGAGNMRHIENNIGNAFFADSLLRVH